MFENRLIGLVGSISGILAVLTFAWAMVASGRLAFSNPLIATILAGILALAATILGVCSIKTTLGKVAAALGISMLAVLWVLMSWFTIAPADVLPLSIVFIGSPYIWADAS